MVSKHERVNRLTLFSASSGELSVREPGFALRVEAGQQRLSRHGVVAQIRELSRSLVI